MPNLKSLKNRISAIKSTSKITKAMQIVSAAKLHKLKSYAHNVDEYSEIMNNIIYDISCDLDRDFSHTEKKFFDCNSDKQNHLLVLITSKKGLCGRFNSALLKMFITDVEKYLNDGKNVKIIVIGERGFNALKRLYPDNILRNFEIDKNHCEFTIANICTLIRDSVNDGVCDGNCTIYYNKFINALTQLPDKYNILPVIKPEEVNYEKNGLLYEYEESTYFVSSLINIYIQAIVNYCILHSRISEEGARMTAMDGATRNANNLLDDLVIELNRSRQGAITSELIEIVSGAEIIS